MKPRSWSSGLRWPAIALCCCLGVGVPAAAAAQGPGDEPPSKPSARVEKLTRQILGVGRLSPLNLKKAAALLGSRLGPRQQIHEYRSEWKLAPTAAIASGTAVHAGKDAWEALWFTPHPSLDLTFEDLAPALFDLPFDVNEIWVHINEDSLAKKLDRFEYRFAVPAGQLIISVPANLSKGAPDREREAQREGYEVAKGRGTTRARISEVLLSTKTSREWTSVPTLRQFRARFQSPK